MCNLSIQGGPGLEGKTMHSPAKGSELEVHAKRLPMNTERCFSLNKSEPQNNIRAMHHGAKVSSLALAGHSPK